MRSEVATCVHIHVVSIDGKGVKLRSSSDVWL